MINELLERNGMGQAIRYIAVSVQSIDEIDKGYADIGGEIILRHPAILRRFPRLASQSEPESLANLSLRCVCSHCTTFLV